MYFSLVGVRWTFCAVHRQPRAAEILRRLSKLGDVALGFAPRSRLENPANDFDFFGRPRNQDHPVGHDAFALARPEEEFRDAIFIDEQSAATHIPATRPRRSPA